MHKEWYKLMESIVNNSEKSNELFTNILYEKYDLLFEDDEKELSWEQLCKKVVSLYNKVDEKYKLWTLKILNAKNGITIKDAVSKCKDVKKLDKIIHKLSNKPQINEDFQHQDEDLALTMIEPFTKHDYIAFLNFYGEGKYLPENMETQDYQSMILALLRSGKISIDDIAEFSHSRAQY